MSVGWSNEETVALLGVWGAAGIQSQLDGVGRTGMCTRRLHLHWLTKE